MIENLKEDDTILFECGHLMEVGDLVQPTHVHKAATIEHTVVMISDPYYEGDPEPEVRLIGG